MVTMRCMNRSIGQKAADSRDAHLMLRRVERQHFIVQELCAGRRRFTYRQFADALDVTERTIARDIERLRHSGLPIMVTAGRGGGAAIHRHDPVAPIALGLPEIAALMVSLAALGPTASESAASAMHKLVTALAPKNITSKHLPHPTTGTSTPVIR